jgi:hypothetical protein
MTYGLPLEFDERIFRSDDLVGTNYLSGFPDIMKAIGNQTYKTTWSDLRTSLDVSLYGRSPNPRDKPKPYVYIVKGIQTVYAKPGRAFQPGADIRVYHSTATGATRSLIAARVLSYDEITGKLKFDAYAINYGVDTSVVEVNKIPTLSARVSIFGSRHVSSGAAQAIANGGTAATSERDALKQIGAYNISDVAEFFCDITDANETNDFYQWSSNASHNFSLGAATTNPEEHPGQLVLSPASGICGFTVGYGYGSVGKSGASFSGAGSYIEYDILVGALPSNVSNYDLCLGLGTNLGPHNTTEGFGIRLTYSLAARFIADAYGASSITGTAVLPAANTWYRCRVANDGANLIYSINGTQIASIGLSGTTLDLTTTNFMPSFGFGSIGTPAVSAYMDYIDMKSFFFKSRG